MAVDLEADARVVASSGAVVSEAEMAARTVAVRVAEELEVAV